MAIFTAIALLLLTLMGYSVGRVAMRDNHQISPGVIDILFVFALWVGAFVVRSVRVGWQAILFGVLTGFIVGAVFTVLVRDKQAIDKRVKQSQPVPQNWWQRWKAFFREVGNFQSRILLAWFYIIVITPFGLIVRAFSDPLNIRHDKHRTYWFPRKAAQDSLENARRQF